MSIPKKTSYLPETVYSDNIISEWEMEYQLPDNMPDISRLIRMDSAPFIESTSTNGSIVNIDGKNSYNLIYQSSEDNKIYPLNLTNDFNLNVDTKSSSDTIMPFAKVFCTFVSCKVISPRRLYIKSKNRTSIDVKDTISFDTPNTDMGNNILFYNTEPFSLQEFRTPTRKTFNLQEEFTVEGAYPPVQNIIFSTVRIIPMDLIKNMGSVTLNASALFKVFYESDGGYIMFSRSVPISLTVEDEEIDENTLVYYALFLTEQSVEKDVDNYGEERVLRFAYSPELVIFKVKESTEELPTDVFSPTELLQCETKTVSYEELCGIISRPFTIEKIFELPDSDLTEIYDTSAVMDVESFEKSEAGRKLDGICSISVLGKTNKGIDSANFTVNFTEDFPELASCYKCECSVSPVQATAMVTGRDIITVRVSANSTVRQYDLKEKKIISDFTTKSSREVRDKSYITLYYPDKSDTLWSISKEYGVNPEEIAKENASAFSKDGFIESSVKSIFIP